jgi:DNA-directed RNA polymerase subunit RPC12/RpoP
MSIEEQLRKEAQRLVDDLQVQAFHAEKQYADIQKRALKLETQAHAKRDAARLAPERLDDYPVFVGGNYHCPRCWIERKEMSVLIPTSEAQRKEGLECRECGHSLTL